MPEALTNRFGEPTKIDTVASDSCTRAGTFALLLSLTLVLLIPYGLQERDDITVGHYLALRFHLVTALEQLDHNPQWQQCKVSHEAAEWMSIEQLLQWQWDCSAGKAHSDEGQTPSSPTGENESPKDTTAGLLRGNPPTEFRALVGIEEIDEIADFLRKLDTPELLTNSRKASSFYDYWIYRWQRRHFTLMRRNIPAVHPGLLNLPLCGVRYLVYFKLKKIDNAIKLGRVDEFRIPG